MNIRILLSIAFLTAIPSLASAYVGPGAGLSAIGSLLALLLAIVVAIMGFFWYPIKRLVGGRKSPSIEEDTVMESNDQQSTDDTSR